MAMDFVEYIKNTWDSIVNGKENDKKKKEALKEIEDYLNSKNNTDLPQKPVLPDTPDYDKIEYVPPTDEDIKSGAESELGEYKNSGINSIENEIESLKKKYEADKLAAADALNKKNSAADEAYGEAKKNTEDNLLKRGIARSSIAANKGAELEGAQAKMKTEINNQYTSDINKLDSEIGGLETKRSKALDDFNISYATKLTQTINDLKKQREDKASEALKYNNSITEKQHQADIDKIMKESDLYGEALSQREKEDALSGKGEGSAKQIETYNKMASALRGMNQNDARKLLMESDMFKTNLDEKYFFMLYDEFAR